MKINYGIHIGENNASIAKVIDGVPVILRSNTLKDSMPVCVSINRRNTILVGDTALNVYKSERLRDISNWGKNNYNTFIGFNRTLGSDILYYSSNAERNFTSTELVAEVIKELCSFEKDEQILAAVITVPVGFSINQIDAIKQAAELAGIEHVEILQEPIAAAMGYGLGCRKKNGFWLVFDFRSGGFAVSLLKVTDGVCQVLDNDIDNYLGGECIDDAIVDEIIMPYLKRNFAIDKLLRDNTKSIILRNTMRFYAKDIKKQLSFEDEAEILTNSGDLGYDDLGDEMELDFTVTEAELEKVIGPVFQKSIDISNKLLRRNNLDGGKLSALILVGGPTYSPILRRMLEKQICKPDTSVDPMTVVSKGAAIYASMIDIPMDVRNQIRDRTKIEVVHSIDFVENLLFHLTEEGMLSSSQFKKYFEQISVLKVKPDETTLQSIYKHLKEYKNEK